MGNKKTFDNEFIHPNYIKGFTNYYTLILEDRWKDEVLVLYLLYRVPLSPPLSRFAEMTLDNFV